MSGLRGIGALLTISLLGAARAFGAPPAVSQPPAAGQKKPVEPAKVSALDYVKAGASLYNKGQVDMAARYFKAADRYRSQLSDNEQIVLEVYLEELEKLDKQRTSPRVDTAVTTAATTTATAPAPSTTSRPNLPDLDAATAKAMTAAGRPGASPDPDSLVPMSRYLSTDPKQRARWLLNESKEQMMRGNFELAAQKIEEAKSLDVKWGFLEESPAKTQKILEKMMAKVSKTATKASASTPSVRPLGVRPPDSNLPLTESLPQGNGASR